MEKLPFINSTIVTILSGFIIYNIRVYFILDTGYNSDLDFADDVAILL